ncbi:hypothetical protein PTKIN_Ptkin03bG0176800 [Pterospermum kingtungense]
MTLEKDRNELGVEIDVANMQIALGKYDDVINTLNSMVQQTENDKDSEDRAHVFVLIGEALFNQGKFSESRRCLKCACKRASALVKKVPQGQDAEGSIVARIGWVLLLRGQVPRAISYLESAAERLKESFASDPVAAGYNYNNLGAAYLELERPQSGAKKFEVAKEMLDVSLGPHHPDSIETCQNSFHSIQCNGKLRPCN